MKVVIYLDDGIAAKKTKESAGKAAQIIIQTLSEAGFYINWKKVTFGPNKRAAGWGQILTPHRYNFLYLKKKYRNLLMT